MGRKTLLMMACTIGVLLFAYVPAQGDLVNYQLEGIVDYGGLGGVVSVGDSWSANFTVDTTTPPVIDEPTVAVYNISLGLDLIIGSLTMTYPSFRVSIYDNHNPNGDMLVISVPTYPEPLDNLIDVGIVDTDGTVFSSTALPTLINLSAFEDGGMRVRIVDGELNYVTAVTGTVSLPAPLPPPQEQIEDIQEFFSDSVINGDLTGLGATKIAAAGKLNALGNMLAEAEYLIDNGYIEEACNQLNAIYMKTDGAILPPDFVTGDAADELAAQILTLMDTLGCE